MKILRGRTAFVTGAASGIGRAIAMALAREGVNLVITDRDDAGLALTQQEAERESVSVTGIVCDLTQPDQIADMLDRQFSDAALHILVNCAGMVFYGQQRAMSDADWRNIIAVNLMAPMQITTRLIATLSRADEAHIVNMASFLGLVPTRRLSAYQASKYGLVGFTLALRNDYHRKNFGVSVICPGFVKTPMLAQTGQSEAPPSGPKIPAWLCTTPEHIAEVTIRAIKRDKGLVVITAFAHAMWRLNRFLPGLVDFLNREGWRSRGPILPEHEPERSMQDQPVSSDPLQAADDPKRQRTRH
jgi:3-oxoacyl-[acyl-carrier protein] reductase